MRLSCVREGPSSYLDPHTSAPTRVLLKKENNRPNMAKTTGQLVLKAHDIKPVIAYLCPQVRTCGGTQRVHIAWVPS